MSSIGAENPPFRQLAASDSYSVAGYDMDQLDSCYWYGKRRFEADLARVALLALKDPYCIPSLETCVGELMTSFPYKQCFDDFRNKLSFTVPTHVETHYGDARSSYLALVGVLDSRGQQADRDLCTKTIEQYANCAIREMAKKDAIKEEFASNSGQTPLTALMTPETSPSDPGSPASSEKEIDESRLRWGRGSLHQYGLKNGFKPWYQTEPSSNPFGAYARVTCGDRQFEAFGAGSEKAKKMVAVKACEQMGIMIVPGAS